MISSDQFHASELSAEAALCHLMTKNTWQNSYSCEILPGTKDKLVGEQENAGLQWFQLGLEEAFYLSYSLNCLQICRSMPEVYLTIHIDFSTLFNRFV